MTTEMRKTGIDVVGDMVAWGAHFCLFYETREDLLDTLIAYCKSGLGREEYCLWIVAEPLTVEEATAALKAAVPDLDRHMADSRMEIVSARDWFLQGGTFDGKRLTDAWYEKLARVSARGYAGMRVTGDTTWLAKKDWGHFCDYEDGLNEVIGNQSLALPCCARTRLRRAELLKSWMWCVHTSLSSQGETGIGTLSKPPRSSEPRPKSRGSMRNSNNVS
jgi:hypothetical protein